MNPLDRPRIATGGILHETSTFAVDATTYRDFEQGLGIHRGREILEKFPGTNTCIGGFCDAADACELELVPLLWTFAYPSGLIDRDAYQALEDEFLLRLRQAQEERPIDGLLLDLHGAMVVRGAPDGDGHFLESVRKVVGADMPVVVTYDLHGNHSRRRVELATATIGYDTYPHVDMAERGREAAALMSRILRGRARPVCAIRQLPMFWSAARQVTSHPPMDAAIQKLHELEQRPDILTATIATGFPWADVPDMGASVIVVADGDAAVAESAASDLAEWLWSQRATWHVTPPSVTAALEAGETLGRYPIFLCDMADNTGGGTPGDSTEILQVFLDRKLPDALLLYMVDTQVAQMAHEAGVGGKIRAAVGGKSHPAQGAPVTMDAEVVAVSDGRFKFDGPMYAGLPGDLGPSAWLRQGGTNVVVVSVRQQPLDQAFCRTLGIDCAKMKYIAVKSAVHFRSGFESIAGSIHNVNAQALHSHDYGNLQYRAARRLYPFGDAEYRG